MTLAGFLRKAGERITPMRSVDHLKGMKYAIWDGKRLSVSRPLFAHMEKFGVDACSAKIEIIQINPDGGPTWFAVEKA